MAGRRAAKPVVMLEPPWAPDLILAVDPGETTGWALFRPSAPLETITVGQMPHFDFLDWMPILLGHGLTAVVCEAFQVGERTARESSGQRIWSIEQQGVLRWLCRRAGVEYVMPEQTASDAKNFVTNEKIRRLGLWAPGEDHARDAIRHAVLYMTRRNLIDPRRLLPDA